MSLTYTLRHRPTGTEEWTEVTGITGTTYELTGLSPGVRYDVEVTAVAASGASSTALVTQRSTRCAPPTQPSVLPAGYALTTGDDGTNGALATSWSTVTGAVSHRLRHRVTDRSDVGWVADALPFTGNWRSVAYGDGVWVAVALPSTAGNPLTMRSTDGGETWATVTMPSERWMSVAYGNGVWIAVAESGSARVARSTDGGETWTAITVPANKWSSVAYGDGVWVAVAVDGTDRVMRSIDGGVTWSSGTVQENTWTSVAFGDGTWVAVAASAPSGSDLIMRSADGGASWSLVEAPAGNVGHAVAYGGSRTWVAVGVTGSSRVMRSLDDGVTWAAVAGAPVVALTSIASAGGAWIAISQTVPVGATTRAIRSTDGGATWSFIEGIPDVGWTSVANGDGTWIAVAGGGPPETPQRVMRAVGAGAWVIAMSPTTGTEVLDATELTLAGLVSAASFDVEVAAANQDGDLSAWSPTRTNVPARIADGGTITTFAGNGTIGETDTTYVVHTFATVGTTELSLNRSIDVDYLVVAGGGGGGNARAGEAGGGGGAGGMLAGTTTLSGTMTVTVGDGGDGGPAGPIADSGGVLRPDFQGADGASSSIGAELSATGGGGGGANRADLGPVTGRNGGSGGGAGGRSAGSGGSGVSGQGFAGGQTSVDLRGGSGGGGAGGAGASAGDNVGAAGGIGLASEITGVSAVYAAGGSGGTRRNAGSTQQGADGEHAGDGGGGAGHDSLSSPGPQRGGSGAQGIVVVRYALPA